MHTSERPAGKPDARDYIHEKDGRDCKQSRAKSQVNTDTAATVAEITAGCERAVFQHRITEVHRRRVVDLGTKLIAAAGYAGDELIRADPDLRAHLEQCLADIERRLELALKQYRKIFSHVGAEFSVWGQR